MPARAARGRFLTFEGIDGCGKTTQLRLLARALRRRGLRVLATREPGGTPLGERIRRLLLGRASAGMDPHAELLLMFAARAQHVRQVIRPALARGRVVLSDRFTDASLAYQGYGRGIDLALIRRLHRAAAGGLRPDLTFVIDIHPRTSVRRARRRNRRARRDEGRFEREALAFYRRVRRGYHALARSEPRRVKLIPGETTPGEIHAQVLATATRRLARVGLAGRGRRRGR